MASWSEEEDHSSNERNKTIRGRKNVISRQAKEVNLSSDKEFEDFEISSGSELDATLKGLRGRGRRLRVGE